MSNDGEYTIEIVPTQPTYEREYQGCWPESLAKKYEPKDEHTSFKSAFYIEPKPKQDKE